MDVVKKRGRPQRSEFEALRVTTWVMRVQQESCAPLAALDLMYASPNPNGKRQRQCLWHKYQKGLVSPKDDGPMGESSVVSTVGKDYPETAVWYRHPFWGVLIRSPSTWPELKEVYLQLEEEWSRKLIENHDPKAMFWRSSKGIGDLSSELKASQSLDAGAVILCLIAESKLRMSKKEYEASRMTFAFWLAQSPFKKELEMPWKLLLYVFVNVLGGDTLGKLERDRWLSGRTRGSDGDASNLWR